MSTLYDTLKLLDYIKQDFAGGDYVTGGLGVLAVIMFAFGAGMSEKGEKR